MLTVTHYTNETAADKHFIHCFVKLTKKHMCNLVRVEGFTARRLRREGSEALAARKSIDLFTHIYGVGAFCDFQI